MFLAKAKGGAWMYGGDRSPSADRIRFAEPRSDSTTVSMGAPSPNARKAANTADSLYVLTSLTSTIAHDY